MASAPKRVRQAHDWYPTERRTLGVLLPWLYPGTRFLEPCAGDGRLALWLEQAGHSCIYAGDIAPRAPIAAGTPPIIQRDALELTVPPQPGWPSYVITNPPYARALMHALIARFLDQGLRSWLLIDARWMFTGQAEPWLRYCTHALAAGRMRMFEGTKHRGTEDFAWLRFSPETAQAPFPRLFPLGARPA